MPEPIIIHVPWEPAPMPRPRARATIGPNGKPIARVYHPTTTKRKGQRVPEPSHQFKQAIAKAALKVHPGPPLTGPLRVDCVFVLRRPQAKVWKTKPMPRYPHTSTPDRDNLDKAVLDSLKGLTWLDDSQVFAGEIQKWVAAGDEQPHVLITITPCKEP